MNELIICTTEDGRSQIKLRAGLGTGWLRPLELAELFQTTEQNIVNHLKAIFVQHELSSYSIVNQRLTTATSCESFNLAGWPRALAT